MIPKALTHHVNIAMQRAVPQLMALLERIYAIIGAADGIAPGWISRAARAKALQLLRPAEALLRRLIVLMADEIEVSTVRSSPRRRGPQEAGCAGELHETPAPNGEPVEPRGEIGRRAQGFRFFEFIPSLASVFGEPDAPKFGPHLPPSTVVKTDAIARRIEALAAAIEARDALALAHAKRLARWGSGGRKPRWNPCRPGLSPGLRSRETPPWLADMIGLFMMKIRRLPLPFGPAEAQPPPG